jgi:hypothetical protein
MRQRTLTLTGPQRDELLRLRDHDPRPYVRERCAAVPLIAGGASPHAVAASRLLRPRDPDTVYAWLNRYQAAGPPRPDRPRPRGGRRRPFRGHRGRG